MAQTRRRSSNASDTGDFFDAFMAGQDINTQHQQLQINQQKLKLDFIEGILKHQSDQQKLKVEMLKAGIEPNSGRPLQRGAFNPLTGDQQDVMYDAGSGGNMGAPGFGGGLVIPKGAPKLPAVSMDAIETDKNGRTWVNLPNGVRMPAIVQIGPGGQVKSVKTFRPDGREALMAVIKGVQEGPAGGKGQRPAQQQNRQERQPNPIQFDEAINLVDQAILKGVKLDVVLSEIDNDPDILPAMKAKLKQEARARFGRRQRGAS